MKAIDKVCDCRVGHYPGIHSAHWIDCKYYNELALCKICNLHTSSFSDKYKGLMCNICENQVALNKA